MKGDLETEKVGIDSVRPHPKNVRQGDIGAICESLQAHGQYRAIVAQRTTGYILAGNHTWKAAKQLGWSNITAHFIDCDDDQAMRILLADNRANDLATYDNSALIDLLKELSETDDGLTGTLYDGDDIDQLIYDMEQNTLNPEIVSEYSQAVKVPHYLIVGEQPAPNELYDNTHTERLRDSIQQIEMPDDVKHFLLLASHRHTVFDYQKIAEYYPHATAEVQQLMEESALIIIDSEDAIANGYAKFAKTMQELTQRDDND